MAFVIEYIIFVFVAILIIVVYVSNFWIAVCE